MSHTQKSLTLKASALKQCPLQKNGETEVTQLGEELGFLVPCRNWGVWRGEGIQWVNPNLEMLSEGRKQFFNVRLMNSPIHLQNQHKAAADNGKKSYPVCGNCSQMEVCFVRQCSPVTGRYRNRDKTRSPKIHFECSHLQASLTGHRGQNALSPYSALDLFFFLKI